MKITIQKREPDKNGHRALRLVYYHGSKTGQNGSRAQKRSYEPLNLFLYDKPRLPAEREHNKTVNQKAEAIRAVWRQLSCRGPDKIVDARQRTQVHHASHS